MTQRTPKSNDKIGLSRFSWLSPLGNLHIQKHIFGGICKKRILIWNRVFYNSRWHLFFQIVHFEIILFFSLFLFPSPFTISSISIEPKKIPFSKMKILHSNLSSFYSLDSSLNKLYPSPIPHLLSIL